MKDKKFSQMLSANMKQAIREYGLTQSDVAHAMGISVTSLSRYLNEERNPSAYMVFLFCETLGISMDWLFGRD